MQVGFVQINLRKQTLRFSNPEGRNQIKMFPINNQEIEQVKKTKFLDLNIDDKFTWKYHIDQVATKISKVTGIMAKAMHYLSLKALQFILWHHSIPLFNIL